MTLPNESDYKLVPKHTPGPWGTDPEIKASTDNIYVVSKAEKDGDWPVIAKMTRPELFIRDESEIKANARLIAAAPELLIALQDLLSSKIVREHINEYFMLGLINAEKAIAKAAGGAE